MSLRGTKIVRMKTIEFWIWLLRDPETGRRKPSRCRLTEAEARRRDPQATRVAGSCELRVLPRHPDDYVSRLVLEGAAQRRMAP